MTEWIELIPWIKFTLVTFNIYIVDAVFGTKVVKIKKDWWQ